MLLHLGQRVFEHPAVLLDPSVVFDLQCALQITRGVLPTPERLLGQTDLRKAPRRPAQALCELKLLERFGIFAGAAKLYPALDRVIGSVCTSVPGRC